MTSKIEIDLVSDGGASVVKDVATIDRRLAELSRSQQQQTRAATRAVQAQAGSYQQLESELREAERELKRLRVGTDEFAQQKSKVDQLSVGVKQARMEVKGLNDESAENESSFAGALRNAKGITTAVVATGTVISGIIAGLTAALKEEERRQRDAALEQVSVQEVVTQNAGNFGESQQSVLNRSEDLSRDLGLSQKLIINELAELNSKTSSAGATPDQQAFAFAQAFEVSRNATIASQTAVAALRRAGEDGQITEDEIRSQLGSSIALQSALPTADLSTFLRNVETSTVAANRDRRELAAPGSELARELQILLSSESGDETGSEVNTFLSRALDTIGDLRLQETTTLNDGTVLRTSAEQIQELRQTRDLLSKIAVLRDDEALAAQVIAQLPDSKVSGIFGALLQGDDQRLVNRFDEIRTAFVTGAEANRFLLDQQNESQLSNQGLIEQQRLEARRERLQADNIRAGDAQILQIGTDLVDSLDIDLTDRFRVQISDLLNSETVSGDSASGRVLSVIDRVLALESLGPGQRREVLDAREQIRNFGRADLQQLPDNRPGLLREASREGLNAVAEAIQRRIPADRQEQFATAIAAVQGAVSRRERIQGDLVPDNPFDEILVRSFQDQQLLAFQNRDADAESQQQASNELITRMVGLLEEQNVLLREGRQDQPAPAITPQPDVQRVRVESDGPVAATAIEEATP